MKTLAAAFLTAAFFATPALAEPTMADCRAMNEKDKIDRPAATKPHPAVVACLNAVLDAKERQALAERERIDANIARIERNAVKLPAE